MAFGLWAGGHLSGDNLEQTLEQYRQASPGRWLIVPSPYKLANGDTGFEILFNDVPQYITQAFLLARRFWSEYKRHGIPGGNWRRLTVQQLAVIDIFDDCLDHRNKLDREAEEAKSRLKGR